MEIFKFEYQRNYYLTIYSNDFFYFVTTMVDTQMPEALDNTNPASAAGLIVFVIFIIKKFKARMLIKLRTERKANEMSGPGRT